MTTQQRTTIQELFTTAYREYEKGLYTHAFWKVSNRETSEDLVQATFLKTWSYLMKGGEIDMMKAFLYHVLNNLIVDEYRKRKTTSLDALLEKGFEPSAGHRDQLFNVLDGKTAFSLIEKIPESYQKIIRMKYLEDLSLKEMSQATGFSKNTLAVKVHRGLEKLKLLYNNSPLSI